MTLSTIFISGPTAIGKSEFALKLAKKTNAEIINADSMQVYKELKILSARPSKYDQKLVKHHLYGHISGVQRYNVTQWCNETISILKQNNEKKVLSIIVGGTGLYIKTLLEGIADIPVVPEKFKEQSNNILLELGLNKFYQKVYKIDESSCKKISKSDSQRLKRIWEVYYATGKTLSEWIEKDHKIFFKNYNYFMYLFFPTREEIYKKVNNRFIEMINNGAINEVEKLLSLNLNKTLPIMKAHGVPEISAYLSKKISIDECISRSQQTVRNYVKRQVTWWKSSKFYNCRIFKHFPSNIELEFLEIIKKIN